MIFSQHPTSLFPTAKYTDKIVYNLKIYFCSFHSMLCYINLDSTQFKFTAYKKHGQKTLCVCSTKVKIRALNFSFAQLFTQLLIKRNSLHPFTLFNYSQNIFITVNDKHKKTEKNVQRFDYTVRKNTKSLLIL